MNNSNNNIDAMTHFEIDFICIRKLERSSCNRTAHHDANTQIPRLMFIFTQMMTPAKEYHASLLEKLNPIYLQKHEINHKWQMDRSLSGADIIFLPRSTVMLYH